MPADTWADRWALGHADLCWALQIPSSCGNREFLLLLPSLLRFRSNLEVLGCTTRWAVSQRTSFRKSQAPFPPCGFQLRGGVSVSETRPLIPGS